jgi:hypothetical protein
MVPQETQPDRNSPTAFKPREFAAGLLIAVAVVFAIAGTRWYVRARTPSSCNSCIANLKQLEGAKDTWALEHGKQKEDIPNWNDIIGEKAYIWRMPECPRGGTYTLGPVAERPRCSIPEHVLP